MPDSSNPSSAETHGFAAAPPAGPVPRLSLDLGAATHVGKVREINEDAYAVCRVGRFVERLHSNLTLATLAPRFEEAAHILMIADGMGGMAAGEVASHTALGTMIEAITHSSKWSLKLDDPATRTTEIGELSDRAHGYMAAIHEAVRQRAAADHSLTGMGTTYTGAYVVGADLFVAHVGDSCASLLRDGRLEKITRDHTLAQTYLDLGILSEGDSQLRRVRHVLTQAVGGPGEDLRADLHAMRLAPGDRLLLCTDGLTGAASPAEIARILETSSTSQEACDALVQLALDHGGEDNVTVVVARFESAGPPIG